MTMMDEAKAPEFKATVSVPPEFLVRMTDAQLDTLGRTVVGSFRRQRNLLQCERDGHAWDTRLVEEFGFKLCQRCGDHEGELPKG